MPIAGLMKGPFTLFHPREARPIVVGASRRRFRRTDAVTDRELARPRRIRQLRMDDRARAERVRIVGSREVASSEIRAVCPRPGSLRRDVRLDGVAEIERVDMP